MAARELVELRDEKTAFWLVWSPRSGRPPKVRHPTEQAARGEAERLARMHPGRNYYVLACVGRVLTGEETLTPRQAEKLARQVTA
jgi:hypothetical protein